MHPDPILGVLGLPLNISSRIVYTTFSFLLNLLHFLTFTVMEVRSVSAGHDKDVSFPSEDDSEHFGDGTEKISLPAELFGKHGNCLN